MIRRMTFSVASGNEKNVWTRVDFFYFQNICVTTKLADDVF